MKKAIIYLIEFLAIQLIVGFIVSMVWQLITKSEDTTTAQIITSTVAASVVTIVLFLVARWTEVSPNWIRTRPERYCCCWCVDPVGMATGTDARTAQLNGKRVRHDSE